MNKQHHRKKQKPYRYFQFMPVLMGLMALAPCTSLHGEESFRSVQDIVSQLSPLDVLANHDGVRHSVDLDIRFESGSARLLPAAKVQVEALAGALSSDRLIGYRIRIIGHTDAVGNEASNLQLSLERANAVLTRLVQSYGIEPTHLTAEGLGETALLANIAPDDGRQRRVEIVAEKLDEGESVDVETQQQQQSDEGYQPVTW